MKRSVALGAMGMINIRLYEMFRTDMHLPDECERACECAQCAGVKRSGENSWRMKEHLVRYLVARGVDTGDERWQKRRLDFALAGRPARRHESLGSSRLLLLPIAPGDGARHPIPAGALGFIECGIRLPDNPLRGIALRRIFGHPDRVRHPLALQLLCPDLPPTPFC